MSPDIGYWDDTAATAAFTHPVKPEWLIRYADRSLPWLDYGCGYGRLIADLERLGFTSGYGVDPSGRMIDRARSEVGGSGFEVIESARTTHADDYFGLVLLVAVLTCIPNSGDQRLILEEIRRILKPGGYLYVSDYPLQTDDRNLDRYRSFEARGFLEGVFEIDDGRVAMRHHDRGYLSALFAGFERLEEEDFEVVTLKGNAATGIRMMLQKPGSS